MAIVPRVRNTSLLALTLAAVLTVGGCGSSEEETAAPRPAESSAEHRTPTNTPEPSTSPAPSRSPSTVPSSEPSGRRPGGRKTGMLAPQPRARTAEVHLLDADQMPALGPDGTWTVEATAPEDPSSDGTVGACHKTSLAAIGALEALRRSYAAPGGRQADQVVARFADARSAWRAHEVLLAWHEDCEKRLSDAEAAVGPVEPITVRTGTADGYRAAYGAKRDRRRAAGLAILRAGAHLSLVEITAGTEHYPETWDPARVALRRIARTF